MDIFPPFVKIINFMVYMKNIIIYIFIHQCTIFFQKENMPKF